MENNKTDKWLFRFAIIFAILGLSVAFCIFYIFKYGIPFGDTITIHKGIEYKGLNSEQHKKLDDMCKITKLAIKEENEKVCDEIISRTLSGFVVAKVNETFDENGKLSTQNVEFKNAQVVHTKVIETKEK